MKSRSGIFKLLLVLPIFWMFDVLFCFVYARYELGYWPRPYQPDPKDVVNSAFLIVSTFGLLYTLIFSPLIATAYLILGGLKKFKLSKGLLAGWAVPIIFFFCDRNFNWDIVEWILD